MHHQPVLIISNKTHQQNRLVLIMVKQFSLALFALLLICPGCNLSDSTEPSAESIYQEPPFNTITDSIAEYPKNAALYIKRGQLLLQKKHTALAVRDFRSAWELRPEEMTALYYTASLFMSGKEEEAIELLKTCIKRYPHNPEFSRRLSEAYLQSGQPEQALKEYNLMLQNDPDNFEALYERGRIQASLKDTAGAIASLERAYALQPLQIFGITLANLYAETENEKVIALCDQLLAKDVDQQVTDPLFLKGVYYSNTGQHAAALEQFELCIKRDWKFTEAYIEKGIILYELKDYDSALSTFSLATTVSNTYADAYYWMGRCYEAKGKVQDATDSYYKALALDRNFAEAKAAIRRLDQKQ